jgi:hypothetical protein
MWRSQRDAGVKLAEAGNFAGKASVPITFL